MQMCHSVFGKGIKYRVKVEMTITRYSYSQIFSSDNIDFVISLALFPVALALP